VELLKRILSAIAKFIGLTVFGIVPDCGGAVKMGYKEWRKK